MYGSLSEFIERLEREGELARVSVRVDPVLEIAEITDRMSKSPGGGKALLFENTGTAFPVITNMFGSQRRMAMALGAESLDEVAGRIDKLISSVLSPKEGLSDKMRMLPVMGGLARIMPKKKRGRGDCQQVVLRGDEALLSALPVLKCWPADGGRFVTLPMVNTLDPDTGTRNVGMYRMQITGERTTGMHWHVHKTGERHYRAYQRRGGRMPVSVCLGGDPVYTYSAVAPMPDGVDEYLLAGFLRDKPVKLVKCITNDIYVPADCDFVIEGYVDPTEEKFVEGPFGDHTGFYSLEDLYPTFHVTAITHRRGAVYPATIVGIPPQEDAYIAEATEKIFLPPIRAAMQPEIEDLHMPPAGVAHNLALVSIAESYAGQALKVAASLWGAGQMMFDKALVAAPAGTDIRDAEAMAALVRRVRIPDDLMFSRGVLDVLDHATATPGVGGKVALDLTAAAVRAEVPLSAPEDFFLTEGIDRLEFSLFEQWRILVVHCEPGVQLDIDRFLSANPVRGVNFIVLADTRTFGFTPSELLWFVAANTDPGRDMAVAGGMMVIDGRTKLPGGAGNPARTPNVVVSSPQTVMQVDLRWDEYGLGKELPSPSERYAALACSGSAEIGRK